MIMVTIFIFEDNLLPVQSSLLKFSSWIEVGVSSMLVLARQTKSCVQVLHTYGEEEPAHCLKVLALVLPGLDTGRYVWIYLPQAGRDKPGKAFWKFSKACSALCCSTGALHDSDLYWSSGALFESLTALATRDLASSKSLVELSINSCSSLQRPPSKAIFKNHFTNKRGNALKERICRIDRLLTRILEQQEFHRPHENYGDWKKPNFKFQFQITTSKIIVSTTF